MEEHRFVKGRGRIMAAGDFFGRRGIERLGPRRHMISRRAPERLIARQTAKDRCK